MQGYAFGVVGFFAANFVLPHIVFDGGEVFVAYGHIELGEGRHFQNGGRFDADGCGMGVGADKAACA